MQPVDNEGVEQALAPVTTVNPTNAEILEYVVNSLKYVTGFAGNYLITGSMCGYLIGFIYSVFVECRDKTELVPYIICCFGNQSAKAGTFYGGISTAVTSAFFPTVRAYNLGVNRRKKLSFAEGWFDADAGQRRITNVIRPCLGLNPI
jgi:hypothetical protein